MLPMSFNCSITPLKIWNILETEPLIQKKKTKPKLFAICSSSLYIWASAFDTFPLFKGMYFPSCPDIMSFMPQLGLRLSFCLSLGVLWALWWGGDPGCTPPQTPMDRPGPREAVENGWMAALGWNAGSGRCILMPWCPLLHDFTEILLFKKAIFFLMTNNERIFKRYQIVAQSFHLCCLKID